MFCEKCGKQIPDGSAFCDGCGAKLIQEAAPTSEAAPAAPAKASFFATLLAKVKAIHQKNKLIFPIAGGVIVVAVALLIVFGILGRQVSVKDYMNITVEGYDGYGYIDFDFGYTSFGMRVVGDKDVKGYDEDLEKEDDFRYMEKGDVSKDYRDNFKNAQKLVDSIKYEWTYPEGKTDGQLSNGDVIKVKITCKESYAEDLGLTLQDLTFEYVVEGLEEIVELDLLSYFDLVGEGYDGYGKVGLQCNYSGTKNYGGLVLEMEKGVNYLSYRYEDEEWSTTLSFYVRPDAYNKSNGDKVEIKVDYPEDYFINQGVKLINLEKEYTVNDLKESQEVDLLTYYEVKFTGVNGDGRGELVPKQETATIGDYTVNLQTGEWTKDGEYIGYTNAFLDGGYSLSDGDVVKAFVTYNDYTFGEIGVKFINAQQEIIVSNLATYVTSLEDITDYTDATEAAKESITNYLNDYWYYAVHGDYGFYSDKVIGDDMKLYKAILATTTNDNAYYKNYLYLVFSVTLSDNALSPTVYYVPVHINNASVYGDGSLNGDVSFVNDVAYTSYEELVNTIFDDGFKANLTITESN